MNYIFHYYAMNFISKKSGFSDKNAFLIAQSSALVDCVLVSYKVKDKQGHVYKNIKTRYYETWNKELAKEILPVFHFFPGDLDFKGAIRLDLKKNKYNTTPASECVKEIFIDALRSKNLYRIGVAAHTFFDSYAHQNFSGLIENWNKIPNSLNDLLPPVGHAQIGFMPDDYTSEWIDLRLTKAYKEVSNRDRFKKAFKQVYKYFCVYNGKSFDDSELVWWEFEKILLSVDNLSNNLISAKNFFKDSIKKSFKRNIKNSLVKGKNFIRENLNKNFKYKEKLVYSNNKKLSKILNEKLNISSFNPFLWQENAFNFNNSSFQTLLKKTNIYEIYLKTLSYTTWIANELASNFKFLNELEFTAKDDFYSSDFYKFSEAILFQKLKFYEIEKNL